MPGTQPTITHIDSPDRSLLGNDHVSFLRNLGGPAWLTLKGRDSSRRRAIVTLLHGNEPSGLKAVHELLSMGIEPATDLAIAVAAVDAALHEPVFSHRYIPGEKDLNRCFAPGHDAQHSLTAALLEQLHGFRPEAIVDTHNTSSHSVPFAVAVNEDAATLALAGMFIDTLVIMDQQLGTLLEYLDPAIPAVTVEFGGFMDPDADGLARRTLHRFIVMDDTPRSEDQAAPVLLKHPFRLETVSHLKVAYSSSVDDDADLTIINTIDQLNFRAIPPGTTLGWFKEMHHRNLFAHDAGGRDRYLDFFSQDDGLLKNRVPMTLFMATTDPIVANTDCLLYFNPGS